MDHDVIVVGGGLAGLFTASELIAAGTENIVVLDKADRPGGITRTIERDGYSLEPAAGTLLLPHQGLSPVLERLGVDVEPAVDAGLRYVFVDGGLVALPSSPKAAFAPLVPWRAKMRAAAEPFIRTPPGSEDESLDELLRRRLGPGVGGVLAWVAASGVFAGDPTRLSARASFPRIAELEDCAASMTVGAMRKLRNRSKGMGRPTSHLPVGGTTGIAETAAQMLGDRYRPGFTVTDIAPDRDAWVVDGTDRLRGRTIVVATRPQRAARLLGGELGAVLNEAVTAPVVVVGLGGKIDQLPLPRGFGVLVGPGAGTATLGVLFESSYAPRRSPHGYALAKVIAGGATQPGVVDWDDETLTGRIVDELAMILGREIDPTFVQIVRHRVGIPQYEVGHGDWLAEVKRLSRQTPGLVLAGWGYRGVGVAHLAADAVDIASDIARRRTTTA